MAVITVPRPLREKLGEEGTDALVALINEAGENNKKSVIEVVEERFERQLSEELGKLRVDLVGEMSKLRVDLAEETSKLRVDVPLLDRPDRCAHRDSLCLLQEVGSARGEISKMEPDEVVRQAVDEFIKDIRKTRVILIRWMFLFAVANVAVTTCFLFALTR